MESATPAPFGYALGIDVSRDQLELALLTPEGHLHRKSVRNNPSGFKALLAWLGRLKATPVQACLEASGGYEEEAALFLHQAQIAVSVVNPRRLKAYAEVQLQRSKTDPADAALIARYCQRERPPLWQPPTPQQRHLRQLTRAQAHLKQERDRTRNRLDGTDNEVVRQSLEALLAACEAEIKHLEAQIEAHLGAHPELKRGHDLLCSIPGIGPTTAAVLLSELGDITRFESARQVAAYAGVVPARHESGRKRSRSRLSKVGNARLRKALYFPALTALRCNVVVSAFGARLAQRGKSKMAIVGAAMRKLLHLCYGVLKHGQPFDASVHELAHA